MALTLSKIKALEAKARKKQQKLDKASPQLQVPQDWAEFARMVKIRSGGDVKPFDPYPYQVDLVNLMIDGSVCVTKARQLGISETIICYLLWEALRNPGYLAVAISKTQVDSSLLARRMKRMINSLGQKTVTENLCDIELMGGGRILFRNSNPDASRGLESVCHVFLDELAFQENGEEIYNALTPAMSMLGSRGRVFCVSTPNGQAGFFYNLLSQNNGDRNVVALCNDISKEGSNPFQYWIDDGGWGKVLIHWRAHPIYGGDPNFLEDIHKKQKLSLTVINQEYNLNFEAPVSAYFTVDMVANGACGAIEEPVKNGSYYMGIDAAGLGDDYGVCVVLRLLDDATFSLVNWHRKKGELNEVHIYAINQLIKKYQPLNIGCEVTGGLGESWYQELVRTNFHLQIERINTTRDSKISMLSKLKIFLELEKVIFPEKCPLKDELLSFRVNEDKLEAAPGKNDDMVMAMAFALRVVV